MLTTALLILLFTVLLIVFLLVVPGNVAGWLAAQRVEPKGKLPFNIRIFFGPDTYFTWLEKREAHEDNVGL